MAERVSVIIPTYNRFRYLLNAIASVKNQTYPDVEIIVVNDASTEREYYDYDFAAAGVKIIHLPQNSRTILGFPSCGYVRNQGSTVSTGKYVAYLDDDDSWPNPRKLELQIAAMRETGCKMSCTEGWAGRGQYNSDSRYPLYNGEHYREAIRRIYRSRGSSAVDDGYPRIWNQAFFNVHNCCIVSSAVLERDLLDRINHMPPIQVGKEDYTCWRSATKHTDCVYVEEPCVYYDLGHGAGQNY